MPSGNGVAARALQALGHLVGEPRYLDAAERTLRAAWPLVGEHPRAYASLLRALRESLEPSAQIVVRVASAEDASPWLAQAAALGARGIRLFIVDAAASDLPRLLQARVPMPGGVAYVCRGPQCLARSAIRGRWPRPSKRRFAAAAVRHRRRHRRGHARLHQRLDVAVFCR